MLGIKRILKRAAEVARPDSLLGPGAQAPRFDLRDQDGERVRSEDLLGASLYVIVFYPSDGGEACAEQLRELSAARRDLAKLDCRLFGVNGASAASHRQLLGQAGLDLTLLVDTNRSLAEAYRTARPGLPHTFRAVFVIDKKGVVRFSQKGRPSIKTLRTFVERAQGGYKGGGSKGRRTAPLVSAPAIRKLIAADARTTVVDLRDPVDWRLGHIPGALNIPFHSLEQRFDALPAKDVPLVMACDQGLRSQGAARHLHAAGWKKLYALLDGMEAYKGELEPGPRGPATL